MSNGSNGNQPVISADSRYVDYTSCANNLVSKDTHYYENLYVHDMVLNTTTMVSVSNTGIMEDGTIFSPSINGDGRYSEH
jgi:hypothetical protein